MVTRSFRLPIVDLDSEDKTKLTIYLRDRLTIDTWLILPRGALLPVVDGLRGVVWEVRKASDVDPWAVNGAHAIAELDDHAEDFEPWLPPVTLLDSDIRSILEAERAPR